MPAEYGEIDLRHYPVMLVMLALTACGDYQPPAQQVDPVWKAEMETLQKARDIEGMVGEISARQRRQIDQQTQ